MYRLVIWSMLLGLFAPEALADGTDSYEPSRLPADHLATTPRHIGHAAHNFNSPEAFQPPVRQDRAPQVRPQESAGVNSAPQPLFAPAATGSNVIQTASRAPPQPEGSVPSAWESPPGPTRDLAREKHDHAKSNAPLPISRSPATPPTAGDKQASATGEAEPDPSTNLDSLITVAGSLCIVLGLFFVVMWCLRRGMPKSARSLPSEVVEVLGRAPLAGKQQMHLIRFGNKLVLAAISPAGVDTISEITDPVEANRLAGYCEQSRSASATASFRGILDRLDERAHDDAEEYPRRPNRGLASLVGLKGARAEDEYV